MSLITLLATSAVLIIATYLYYREVANTTENFLAAGRDTGSLVGGITILATWAAAPAVLIPAQLGYARGLSTALWFTIPNALTLVIFGIIAVQIRKRLPKGYTIAELFRKQAGHIYIIVTALTFAKSFVALAMGVVGGATFLTFFSNLPRFQSILIIMGTILSYSLIAGLNASIFTDVVQTIVFTILYIVFVPWSISAGNGLSLVADAIRSGVLVEMFSGSNIQFALVLGILLVTAPIVSQYTWQRAYAIEEKKVVQAFTLAGCGFFFIPASMAVLGLIAASSGISLERPILASYVVMNQAIPSASLVIFLILLTTLLSAADSALVATASIISVDVMSNIFNRDVNETRISRYAMVVASIAVAIAAMGPFNTLDWVLLNAPIGAVLTIPILTYLYTPNITNDTYTITALVAASLIAFPLYIYGTFQDDNMIRLIGLIGALIITGLLVHIIPLVKNRGQSKASNL